MKKLLLLPFICLFSGCVVVPFEENYRYNQNYFSPQPVYKRNIIIIDPPPPKPLYRNRYNYKSSYPRFNRGYRDFRPPYRNERYRDYPPRSPYLGPRF